MIRLRSAPWGLIAIVAGFFVAMAAITPVDYGWTVYLIEHRWDPAVTFLRRTVFEGSALGASDLPIFGLLILIGMYVWASSRRASPMGVLLRPWLGFGMVATLAAGLGAVHTVKWIVGRARPYEVVAGEHLPFTPWYWPGPHFITEGVYRGSFPSGHTAVALLCLFRARRLSAGLSMLYVPIVTGIIFSTVYLHYHYVVDVLAGAALACAGAWLGPRLEPWCEPGELVKRLAVRLGIR